MMYLLAGIYTAGWIITFLGSPVQFRNSTLSVRLRFPAASMDGDASPVAQQVAVSLVDDIDGSPAKETVQFNLDNRGPYEIDLNGSNASRLRDALAPFVAAASSWRTDSALGARTTSLGPVPGRDARNS